MNAPSKKKTSRKKKSKKKTASKKVSEAKPIAAKEITPQTTVKTVKQKNETKRNHPIYFLETSLQKRTIKQKSKGKIHSTPINVSTLEIMYQSRG